MKNKIKKIFEKIIEKIKKFKKPTMIMRKTYQKKTWKKMVFLILVVALILAIIGGIIFLVKKKKNAPHSLPKNSISVDLQEPGKVIEIDNLDETFPAGGEIIAQGRFNNVEQVLTGKALFVKSGGDIFLRLEDFEMVNGQDMHIYLSPILNLDKKDVIDLGPMKSTTGNVNYSIDKSVDLEKYFNVLIWSNRFSAFFGYAVLQKGELPPEVVPEIVPIEEQNNSEASASDQSKQPQIDEVPEVQDLEKTTP
ncbi:MAG: hypothetical protein A2271_02365 [Candidatus Moranbacteria bacterium RIFOXYA12_FULL_35_19]|nr:MAG: hypothetical protein A2343_00925 [Candidatus Moranbacteria bacterium RIFOXYB12_FULL_35_8]OGI35384.1 MAG: hypothetical protein A2271_02365 [Candidatus Moranbacteria bacterium RIFOXYA12_FULL_35_19]